MEKMIFIFFFQKSSANKNRYPLDDDTRIKEISAVNWAWTRILWSPHRDAACATRLCKFYDQ